MKHIRKVMAAGLAIVLLIAIVIGTGIILSVRNVNVTFIDYTGAYVDEYNECRNELDTLKGSGLLFINDGDVESKVKHNGIISLESYEKVFPCTLNVVLRERVECFALSSGDGYKIYDSDGIFLRDAATSALPLNVLDSSPDVLVDAAASQIGDIAELCKYFSAEFGSVRRLVSTVSVRKYLELSIATLTFRSGLVLTVSDWQEEGELKIKKACAVYSALGDAERLAGTITVAAGRDGGAVIAKYDAAS